MHHLGGLLKKHIPPPSAILIQQLWGGAQVILIHS